MAFSPIAERIDVPPRTIAVIHAEGLLNDGTALVIYASAVTAVSSGAFVFRAALLGFIVSALGAIVLGLAVGMLVTFAWRRMHDTDLIGAMSVVTPFLAYIPAHRLGISRVVAVVTANLSINRFAIAATIGPGVDFPTRYRARLARCGARVPRRGASCGRPAFGIGAAAERRPARQQRAGTG